MPVPYKEISYQWTFSDYLGQLRTVLGIRRNQYNVEPGLYALGKPRDDSPVLVTANYKLTLDLLRKSVQTLNVWVLVLNTCGVNVWCAAGKGTFGTDELIGKIHQTELSLYVSHRKLILPQLGAPGINPVTVKEKTGFSVLYGPVECTDIPEFIKKGFNADESMRKKEFLLKERLTVAVTHFSQGLKWAFALAALFVIVDYIFQQQVFLLPLSVKVNAITAFISLFTGSIAVNALLPYLPGRSFSLKGLSIGIFYSIFAFLYLNGGDGEFSILYSGGKVLLMLAFIVYQALNLTGSSTYTSLAGVQKEMRVTIPLFVISLILSISLIVTGGLFL